MAERGLRQEALQQKLSKLQEQLNVPPAAGNAAALKQAAEAELETLAAIQATQQVCVCVCGID